MTQLGTTTLFSAETFALGPASTGSTLQTIAMTGATLLHAPRCSAATAGAALKALKEFDAEGRRVVWCNATELAGARNADLRGWGRKLLEAGGADVAVLCGVGGREMAVAARDAGLPLTRVVVCREDATARNLLSDSLATGDVLLALGVSSENCQMLADRLESRFEGVLTVAR